MGFRWTALMCSPDLTDCVRARISGLSYPFLLYLFRRTCPFYCGSGFMFPSPRVYSLKQKGGRWASTAACGTTSMSPTTRTSPVRSWTRRACSEWDTGSAGTVVVLAVKFGVPGLVRFLLDVTCGKGRVARVWWTGVVQRSVSRLDEAKYLSSGPLLNIMSKGLNVGGGERK